MRHTWKRLISVKRTRKTLIAEECISNGPAFDVRIWTGGATRR